MKKTMLSMLVIGIVGIPMHAVSADIVNGWSQSATITRIHSLNSATLFKLSVGSETCGHPDFWSLPLEDTARGRAKLSILLAAYTAGKTVSLRCENSAVTDFEVIN